MADRTRHTRTVLLALMAIWAAAPLAAQQQAMSATEPRPVAFLEGQILDSISGDPIPGVLVQLDSGQRAFTDARGRFEFSGLPEGRRLVAMMTADCRVTWGQVTVVERFPRDIQFRLPPAFGAKAAEEERESEERRRTSGRRLEAHEIEGMNASNVMELVRRLAPNMLRPTDGAVGATPLLTSGRGRSISRSDPPVLLIDGVRVPSPEGTLAALRPGEIQSIEIQPGAAAGWEYGSSGASGVIRIELKRGAPSGAPERLTAGTCEVPGFHRM